MEKNTKVKAVLRYQVGNRFEKLHTCVGRGTIYKRNYIPLYCVETALWLAECSHQTYYSATEYKTDDFAPGVMNLDTLGLDLEADIYNEESDMRAFIASNATAQVDGEEDSIIVVAFRGTASTSNVRTDFNWGQVPLPETFQTGTEVQAEYQINVSNTYDPETAQVGKCNLVQNEDRQQSGLKHEADNLLRSAPITRQAFACVHVGFIESYALFRNEVIEKVVEVMQRQIIKSVERCSESDGNEDEDPFVLPKIYVTGHSLGGALAQLLALDIACNVEIKLSDSPHSRRLHRGKSEGRETIMKSFSHDSSSNIDSRPMYTRRNSFPSRCNNVPQIHVTADKDSAFVHGMLSGKDFTGAREEAKSLRPPIAVYTFGQPRVGNHAFAGFYKAHVPHTFRLVCEGDPITTLPMATVCPYTTYKHAGLEVAMDEGNTGNILVGPTVVETLFRFSNVRTNLFAHLLENYRDSLESALTADELQEFYRSHGVQSRSIRSSYNNSDMLPDWVMHLSQNQRRF